MPPLTGIGRFRVRKNDRLLLRIVNSVAAVLSCRIRVLYDNGMDDDLFINPETGTADRVVTIVQGTNRALENGWIVGGEATVSSVATKRGQFYLDISTTDGSTVTPMAKGYVYDGHSLTPGEFTEAGPGGGEGFRSLVVLISTTGDNDAAVAMAATNAFRRVYGLALYYNCAAVAATRTMRIGYRDHNIALPTGYAQNTQQWQNGADLTLTTGEEGAIYAIGELGGSFVSRNDNGTLTIETTEVPFPISVREDDSIDATADITAGEATDVYILAADIEEWLVI